jgi:AhpD family alkylhydroperoxidase
MKLDIKAEELIAIGASLAANCGPCLKYHTRKARENGASNEEITRAIEVGKRVRTGAASNVDRFASSLIEEAPSNSSAASEECGCK